MPIAELTDVGLFAAMPRYGELCIHAVIDLRRGFTRDALERAPEALRARIEALSPEARFLAEAHALAFYESLRHEDYFRLMPGASVKCW